MQPSNRQLSVALYFDLRMLLQALDYGGEVLVVWVRKSVMICEVLIAGLGLSVVQVIFEGNYSLFPGIHSPIGHPCRGLLLLRVNDFEVEVVGVPLDDERVTELRPVVGS